MRSDGARSIGRSLAVAIATFGLVAWAPLACGPKPPPEPKPEPKGAPTVAAPPAPPAVSAPQAAVQPAPDAAPAPPTAVDPAHPAAPRVDDLPALDRDGLIAHISKSGARATVVTVWASWCVPCVEEMPMLSRYYDAHRAQGLEILGLALDDRTASGAKIQRVLDRVRVSYPMAVIAAGQAEAFIAATSPEWDGMLPAAVLFDGAGHQRGFVTQQLSEETLTTLVEPLLAR